MSRFVATHRLPRSLAHDLGFRCLLLVVLCQLVWLLPKLLYPSLALDYPFVGGDTYDWLANGLRWVGAEVRYSARLPLLPLLVALAERANLLPWLPLALQLVAQGTILALYAVLRRQHPWQLSLLVSLAWLMGFVWRCRSLELMADMLAACLLAWALFFARWAECRPKLLLVAGFCGGLSTITQPLAWLLPLSAAAIGVLQRRRPSRRHYLAMVAFLGPTAIWWLIRQGLLVELIDVEVRHWGLLRVSGDAVGFYLIAGLRLLGLPALILAVLGLPVMLRRARTRSWEGTLLLLLVAQLLFFVLFYGYSSQRFMTYAYLPTAFLVAAGLSHLRPPLLRRLAALFLLVGLCLPQPGDTVAGGRQVALWPLPPIYLDLSAQPSEPSRWQIRPLRDLWRTSFENRVLRARLRPLAARHLTSASVGRGDLLLLLDHPAAQSRAYREAGRLATHLQRRVSSLPTEALLTSLAGYDLALEPAGVIDRWQLFRTRPPGLGGSWLIAVDRAGAGRRQLEAWPAGGRQPKPSDLARARRLARRAASATPVILGPIAAPWRRWLPFLLSAREPIVPLPRAEPQIRQQMALAEELDRELLGPVRLRWIRALDRHWLVIEHAASDP